MKLSLKWLNQFVEVNKFLDKPEELAKLLTSAGLEVEEIENKKQQYKNVVVARILKKEKHPEADKLSVCMVTTGQGVTHQIVCGAKNHQTEDKVVLALPGAVLPGNFAIQKSKIRGIESGGMLCSLKELGLNPENESSKKDEPTDKQEGILILPKEAKEGQLFSDYMGLNDVVFELKVTPNRADCLSHLGLAREVACLLSAKVNEPYYQIATELPLSTKNQIALEVLAPESCPRYCGRSIQGIKVGPSPDWLKQKVESVGVKSINNVVDITNYIMFELGQPLHAFDKRDLQGQKIIVAMSTPGEKFQSFDGSEITLSGDELTIRDQTRVVALAGIVGGLNSGVKDSTTDLFIEAAYFQPKAIRKTSRKLGIMTDSCYRFSRGVDPSATLKALDRACQLLVECGGGQVLSDPHDFYPKPVIPPQISVCVDQVSKFLGYKAENDEFEKWMTQLGCYVEKKSSTEYTVTPPSYRFDLETQMDFVEEYARLHGYEHIPESLPPLSTPPSEHDKCYLDEYRLSEILVSEGYSQIQNLAFESHKFQNQILGDLRPLNESGMATSPNPIKLMNPLSEETSVMRRSLLPGLIKTMAHNFNCGNLSGRIFEVGGVINEGKSTESLFVQSSRVGVGAWGYERDLWTSQSTERTPVVFWVKRGIENLLRKKGLCGEWVASKSGTPSFLHRGQFAFLNIDGQNAGYLGTLHPSLCELFNIRVDAAVGEFSLEGHSQIKSQFEGISKFPCVERDLALVMAKRLPVAQIEKSIRKAAAPTLRAIAAYDLYEGEQLEKGLKSVTFRLVLQDTIATLTEQRINQVIQNVLDSLKKEFSITLR